MKREKSLVAICIPTHNHPEVVEDVLRESLDIYKKYNVDVYYYDSSENDDTQRVINSFKMVGYSNLYYVRVPYDWGVDYKVQMIFSQYKFQKDYEYIIPLKDRVYYSDNLWQCVISGMQKKPDIMLVGLSVYNNSFGTFVEYTNPVAFYRDCGWLTTSLDAVIYRYKSILSDFDMEQYNIENKNKPYNIYWVAYVLLFRKLAEGKRVIAIISDNDRIIINSELGKSSWKNDTFKIWKDYWIAVNEGLPQLYNEIKKSVIKTTSSLPWLLGSRELMIELHEMGVLTPASINQVLDRWEEVSNIPPDTMVDIAYGIYDSRHDTYIESGDCSHSVAIINGLLSKVKQDRISINNIPFELLEEMSIMEIEANTSLTLRKKEIIQGSISDVIIYIKMTNTKENTVKGLQMLVSYLLLLNNKYE